MESSEMCSVKLSRYCDPNIGVTASVPQGRRFPGMLFINKRKLVSQTRTLSAIVN